VGIDLQREALPVRRPEYLEVARQVPKPPGSAIQLQGIYMFAELDLPPTVDPTLTKLLDEVLGPYDGPVGVTLTIPQPIKGNAETITAFVTGLSPRGTAIQLSAPMSPSIRALEDYRLEVFGPLVDPDTVQSDRSRIWQLTIPLPVPGDPIETFWLLGNRRRAFLGNTLLYTELRWHPGLEEEDEHVRFGGLEHPHGVAELRALDEAIHLLRQGLPRVWEGQAPNSRNEYVNDYVTAMLAVVMAEEIPLSRVTWKQMDDHLGLTEDGGYYRRKLAVESKPEITKPEVRALAEMKRGAEFSKGSPGDTRKKS